eukprot:m.35310 g.35310  ORF g.35310 m.35310 type:complete len:311 (+) comp10007_c0_seq2:34-966(+)
MEQQQLPLRCTGHTRPVMQVAFSACTADGVFLASASKDNTPMLRDGVTGDWIGSFVGHEGAVWGVDIDEEALVVASSSADFTVKLWDATTGAETRSIKHKHIVKSVSLSKDVNQLVTGCNDKVARLFDLRAPNKEGQEIVTDNKAIDVVKFVCDDSHVVVGGANQQLISHCISSKKENKTEVNGTIKDVFIKSNGQLLVSSTNAINTFNDNGTSLIDSFTTSSPVYTACSDNVNGDSNLVVWGGDDHTVHLCSSEMKEKEKFKSHFGAVHCARFSPDGELFASCSEDGNIFLWQTYPGTAYGLWKETAEK